MTKEEIIKSISDEIGRLFQKKGESTQPYIREEIVKVVDNVLDYPNAYPEHIESVDDIRVIYNHDEPSKLQVEFNVCLLGEYIIKEENETE